MSDVKSKVAALDCCPDFNHEATCDTLNFRYRLMFQPRVGSETRQTIPVEVILHVRLQRCSNGVVVGDPIYSTTLFPGEEVRLFTQDRHSRWTYDSESNLAYRHETTSEESFFTTGMAESMSNLTIGESGSSSSSNHESWAQGGGSAGINLGIISIGGGGGGGVYNASSFSSFTRSLSRHAEASSSFVAATVRAKSSTAIGEVERRQHAESESEAHFESSSRRFRNPNKCHAITYQFYKLNKKQTIRFEVVAIERRVADPAAPTGAVQREPVDTTGRVGILKSFLPAASQKRFEVEKMARVAATDRIRESIASAQYLQHDNIARVYAAAPQIRTAEPIAKQLQIDALEAVDSELIEAGILDEKREQPSKRLIGEINWERTEILPTPGIIVKGCLDECSTCEETLQMDIRLDLERKQLENKLLARQIELLENSQEYRCCPASEEDDNDE